MAAGENIACQEVVELVTDFMEDALTSERAEELRAHFDLCADCSRYLQQIRLAVRRTRDLGIEDGPADEVRGTLIELFDEWLASPAGGSEEDS